MLKRVHGAKQGLEAPETLDLWKSKNGCRAVVLRNIQRNDLGTILSKIPRIVLRIIVLRAILWIIVLRVIRRIIILVVILRIIIPRIVRILRRIMIRRVVIFRNRGPHFERRGDKRISWRSFLVLNNRIFYLIGDIKKIG